MANTIGKVRAVFTASTSGLMSAVQQASGAFRRLGGDASALTSAMGRLEGISAAGIGGLAGPSAQATAALADLRKEAEFLIQQLASGAIKPDEFKNAMNLVTQSASQAAADLSQLEAQFASGASIAAQVATPVEKYNAKLRDLDGLLKVGAISQRTYSRAVEAAKDELQKSQAGANAFAAGAKRVESSVSGVTSRLNALVAIQGAQLFGSLVSSASSAIRSLIGMGQAEADVIDQTSKLAARLGMTYGELSGLGLAGELAGVSLDSIGKAATKADVAFVKAAGGSKQATNAFKAIGLSVNDLNGMTAADRFDAITNAIAALPTEAQRAAAAVQIFGRSGAELLPLFNQGAGGIAAARAEAERFGLALTDAQGRDVENMNDAFTRAKAAIQGVVQQVVAYLSPAVTAVTTAFSDMIGTVGGANIGQSIGEAILSAAQYFAGVADYFVAQVPAVWSFLESLGAQWLGVWKVGGQIGSVLAAAGRGLELVFKGVGSIIIGSVGRVLNAVGELTQAIPGWGQVGRNIEKAGEGMMRTSTKLWNEAAAAAEAVGTNVSDAIFGSQAAAAGEAYATPISDAIGTAIDAARNAAAEVSQAKPQDVDIKQTLEVETKGLRQAVNGIESRSSEGIKEMFRIMRGDTGNKVAEEQLDELRGIRSGIEDLADADAGVDVYDLAPAAGG
jgi:hypothetical protein